MSKKEQEPGSANIGGLPRRADQGHNRLFQYMYIHMPL